MQTGHRVRCSTYNLPGAAAYLATICILLSTLVCEACINLDIISEELGVVRFNQVPLEDSEAWAKLLPFRSGRAAYISEVREDPIYIYHTIDEQSGMARWVVNKELGSTDVAMAYVDSWAVTPWLIESSSGGRATSSDGTAATTDTPTDTAVLASLGRWMIPSADGWEVDPTLRVQCVGNDDTLFFESNVIRPELRGFYVLRSSEKDKSARIWSHISFQPWSNQPLLYLFHLGENKPWLVGDTVGVDSGLAHAPGGRDGEPFPPIQVWNFATGGPEGWMPDETAHMLMNKLTNTNIFSTMQEGVTFRYYNSALLARNMKDGKMGLFSRALRNDVIIPAVGLGTGGIFHEDCVEVFANALEVGYRMFDSAREYGNEHYLPEAIEVYNSRLEGQQMSQKLTRANLFMQSKVWPTQLGFVPTTNAIVDSLLALQTTYVNQYMLHWPACDHGVSWMHCDDTVDPSATWKESWKALEKAYAEGQVMSIGVSNFDARLLKELEEEAVVMPHLVQNWAEPGSMDLHVRAW